MEPSIKCHDTFVETLTVSCENGVYMPLGFKCTGNKLTARIYDNSRFQNVVKTGTRVIIYLVKDGLLIYNALKRRLKTVYSERAKCQTIKEMDETTRSIIGTVIMTERKNGYTEIKVQLHDDKNIETLSREGYSRADGCLIEILVYFTKCKAGVLSPREYNEIYRLCSRSIKHSSSNEDYIKVLDDLKC